MYETGLKMHVHECRRHGKPRSIRPGLLADDVVSVASWILERCDICNITFHKVEMTQRHCKKHLVQDLDQQKVQCNICGDNLDSLDIREHVRIVHS
jgi:hypothetical protein